MKPTPLILLGTSIALVSCSKFDPDYAAYKKEQEAINSSGGGLSNSTDPYGSQVTNPYGVPGASGSEVGTYTPSTSTPYQPLPSVPSNTPNAIPPRSGFPTIPSGGTSASPGASGGTTTTHIVGQGDSLWGLSQKYGTSVDSIKQANGMTNDTVILGSTIQIPR